MELVAYKHVVGVVPAYRVASHFVVSAHHAFEEYDIIARLIGIGQTCVWPPILSTRQGIEGLELGAIGRIEVFDATDWGFNQTKNETVLDCDNLPNSVSSISFWEKMIEARKRCVRPEIDFPCYTPSIVNTVIYQIFDRSAF